MVSDWEKMALITNCHIYYITCKNFPPFPMEKNLQFIIVLVGMGIFFFQSDNINTIYR